MSRPSLLPLPDTAAAILVRELQPLLSVYPAGTGSHRPFVREFIRVVFNATGRSYNPTIYRKLLAAYAPGRSPSTDTLASEKKAFDAALAEEAHAGREFEVENCEPLEKVVQRAVNTALAKQNGAGQQPAVGADRYLQAQLDFLQARLHATESQLNEIRKTAAQQAAELQVAQAMRDTLQAQVDTGHQLARERELRLDQLTAELAGTRKFAMNAIDSSRGETRAQQERANHLETLLKAEKSHTEVFRRLAYRAGAAIPDSFSSKSE